LDWEIQQNRDEGVEMRLSTRGYDVPGLFKQGYDAVVQLPLVLISAWKLTSRVPSIHNWLSLDLPPVSMPGV